MKIKVSNVNTPNWRGYCKITYTGRVGEIV